MPAPVIQFKRGVLTNLPGLRAGEPGFTTDSYDLYVGIDSTTSANKFVGSNRFWTRNTGTTGSGVNLVEGTDNGSNYITLASPASLAGIVTYYFPGTQGSADQVLSNDGRGNLSWVNKSSSAGVTTFTAVVDNELGNVDTGAVQIDGGLGIASNTTVGGNLHVIGYSEFVGVVTFKGGAIGLGDADTDTITVGGEFGSSLIPTDDDTHNLGSGAKRWKNVTLSGIVTAASFNGNVTTNSLTVSGAGVTAILDEDGLTSDRADALATQQSIKAYVDAQVTAQDLDFAGDSGTGAVDLDSQSLTIAGTANEIETSASGQTLTVGLPNNVTIGNNLTVSGNLFVNGSTTQVNTTSLTVEDALIEVGMVDGSAPSSDLNIDLGLLLNYYDGSAKKAAVYWDESVGRIVLANEVSENTGVLTASEYGTLEIGSLFLNDCAGSSQVISCTGSTRSLENITIDAGTF